MVASELMELKFQKNDHCKKEFNPWIRGLHKRDNNELQFGHLTQRPLGGSDLQPFLSLQSAIANQILLIIALIEAFIRILLRLGFYNVMIRTGSVYKDELEKFHLLANNNREAKVEIEIEGKIYKIPYATY